MESATVKYWETIKSNCIAEFCSNLRQNLNADIVKLLGLESVKQIKEGTFKGSYKLKKEVEDKCVKLIENCDIRAYNDLAKAFPARFPDWIKNGRCSVELLDNGWAFVKN